ncbi:unnamed protein product [Orchesella dallaii]|uniref:CHK kinase-like domain-containing protein n=1 Tax=Orchesella dallaii TaxID=48710 RepID=A0ABP1R0L8_9HEXA
MDPLKRAQQLDKDFISKLLGQSITSFSLSEGSKKGDNVIGKMLSVQVSTEKEEKNLHLVIKSLLPLIGECDAASIGQARFVTALQVFPTELEYYKKIRPLLQQISGFRLDKPKFFNGVSDGMNDYIALEDLRPQGYKMADKKKGLSLPQVLSTLKEIAHLHAYSYFLIESQNEEIIEAMSTSFSPLNNHVWARSIFGTNQSIFFNGIIGRMIELLREKGEVENARKIGRFAKEGHKILLDLWGKTRENGNKYFRTLIHGDLWTNNIFFKGSDDGETVEDVKFIDFQQTRFGNVFEELHYFFFTSTSAEFRKKWLKTCLESYFQEFERVLRNLGTELPQGFTEEELVGTFYENIEYGFAYALVAIPFQLGEPLNDSPTPGNQPTGECEGGKEEQQAEVEKMLLEAAETLKLGAQNSPVAIQRLKELADEMVKLNV